MSVTSRAHRARTLPLLVAAAGLAHLPVTPEHLREAPYVGVAFVAFAAVGVVLAVAVWLRPSTALVASAGVLCAVAVVAYAATRLVAFPQIGDDVGNWAEPWGVVSVVLELLTLALACGVVVSRRGAVVSRRAPVAPVEGRAAQQRAAA